MKKLLFIAALLPILPMRAALPAETPMLTDEGRPHPIDSVVVTGARYRTDIRHLPMSVSTVDRRRIEQSHEQSLLPVLTEQVPGLFTTSRGIMGYSVSTGAAGQMSLRGIGGAPQDGLPTTGLMVLIDGHPQYMGLMGHPIADAYQSMLADRVEVLRGPASVLYGSNAMGGVINIVTRKMHEDGVKTGVHLGYGSYNTLQSEISNRIRAGRFTSVLTGSYNRTDGHRPRMGFEQYGGYAKLGYEIARAWNVSADVNLTHFNASNPGSITAPLYDNDSHITRGMTSIALQNDYDRTSGALSFFYNWGHHKINDG
ncbi:MAG: TonB-dependent receptor plug domain-containing protein, partial [Alistipes sp.]|nr:TonB-dependent receptor plug domain-containing protein [Alistipes sp.]